MASAISPKGDLVYLLRNQPFNAKAITEFLELLLKSFDDKLLIIWDNASIHNCKETRKFLASHEDANRLWLVHQPKYSPELNADEQVWKYLKSVSLKNTCNRNVKELEPKIIQALEKMKNNAHLIAQFFHHPDLGFYN